MGKPSRFCVGPFSPIYGVGAVVLTLFLNRFYYTHDLIIFSCCYGFGLLFGVWRKLDDGIFLERNRWDYTGTFGSIAGRTNFFFGVMWGTLGLFWVRMVLPIIKRIQFRFPHPHHKVYKTITWILIVFMFVNAVVTVLALHREGQRSEGIPAASLSGML